MILIKINCKWLLNMVRFPKCIHKINWGCYQTTPSMTIIGINIYSFVYESNSPYWFYRNQLSRRLYYENWLCTRSNTICDNGKESVLLIFVPQCCWRKGQFGIRTQRLLVIALCLSVIRLELEVFSTCLDVLLYWHSPTSPLFLLPLNPSSLRSSLTTPNSTKDPPHPNPSTQQP